MGSERSDGGGERGEFACSSPTRSDSQKQRDFTSKLDRRKGRYLQAHEVRKEEAAGIGEPSLRSMVFGGPLDGRIKRD